VNPIPFRERVSKINLATHLSYATGWTMRVWREERFDAQLDHVPGHTHVDNDIAGMIARNVQFPVPPVELAKAVLSLERVTAVEVLDFSGFGEKLTKI
jgi:hypothetical protein